MMVWKTFLVSKYFGIFTASLFIILHPERLLGFITLGVPFILPGSKTVSKDLPKGFYVLRWQELGRAEADFRRFDVKTAVCNIYILFSKSEIPIAREDRDHGPGGLHIMNSLDLTHVQIELPLQTIVAFLDESSTLKVQSI